MCTVSSETANVLRESLTQNRQLSSKAFSFQAQELEFDPQNPCRNARVGGCVLEGQCWRGQEGGPLAASLVGKQQAVCQEVDGTEDPTSVCSPMCHMYAHAHKLKTNHFIET